MRAIVHIAGRPDPDGLQRCIVCRQDLRWSVQPAPWPMGRDVAQVVLKDSTLHYELGDGPPETLTIRCTAL